MRLLSKWANLGLLAAVVVIVVSYQNCSNQMSFDSSEDVYSLAGLTQYAEATAGDEDSFPPLKLVFVVDNSGTMGVNQINLATAFDRMFSGTNANNLSLFKTSAYIVSTSQYVPETTSTAYPRIPTADAESFAALNPTQLAVHRGALLSGRIPGDLVGFWGDHQIEPSREVTSFRPAPVALFKDLPSGERVVSYSSDKPRNVSVETFSDDFKQRLALLNPDLSEIDPNTRRGVLDDVIDQESGLCAMARVLKHSDGMLAPGDLTSFVFVSDENDSDSAGRACVDSLIQGQSNVQYVDGVCEAARTTLRYRAELANPSYAKCRVDHSTGFSYRFDYRFPTTNVSYYTKATLYDQLRTSVSYYTSSMLYDQLRTSVTYSRTQQVYDAISTPVAYHTKAPTYEIPRTRVQYFREVEDCDIRDGIKTNCRYTYPGAFVTLDGAFGANCDAFVAGKLPTGALYDRNGYKPICSVDTPLARTGACNPNDPNIQNCRQNYSAPINAVLTGRVTSTCAAFVGGRLPTGALYTETGYLPACGNTIVDVGRVGSCTTGDLDKQNCRTEYVRVPTAVVLNGIPGGNSCQEFARNRLPSGAAYDPTDANHLPACVGASPIVNVAGTCSPTNINIANCRTVYAGPTTTALNGVVANGNCQATFQTRLPTNAVLNDATRPVTCAAAATVPNVAGACSTTDPNVSNCRTQYSSVLSIVLDGAPIGGNCAAFVNNRLPSGSVYTDAGYLPGCAPGAGRDQSATGSLAYSQFPATTVTNGADCASNIASFVVSSRGLVVASGTTPSCRITGLTAANSVLADATRDVVCATADWRSVCDASGGSRRGCAPTDIAAGDRYDVNVTSTTTEGQFSCSTLCANTTFCANRSGTVGDNYYACQTEAAAPITKSNFAMIPAGQTDNCAMGQTRRVTRGPYQTDELRKTYVAGAPSENNEPNALIDYIVERSRGLFREVPPIISVFVRQPGDPLGNNGSLGTAYNALADRMGGKKRSVLSNSAQYAQSLEDLSAIIRKRLGQTVRFNGVEDAQRIRRLWFRPAGSVDWGNPLNPALWTSSGGTVVLDESFTFKYGDQFRVEFW